MIRFSQTYDARHAENAWLLVCAAFFLSAMQVGCSTPLLTVSARGDINAAQELIQQGHDVNEAFPVVGTTALMLAASHGHGMLVQLLIDAGADVNAKDFTGWTALHSAAYKGDPKIVACLLEHGAVPQTDRWFLQNPAGMAEALGHGDLLPLLRRAEDKPAGALPSFPVHRLEPLDGQQIPTHKDGPN